MRALLEHQHPDVRRFELQLPRKREAGEAAPGDDCIVRGRRAMAIRYFLALLCRATRAAASSAAFASPR